MTHVRLIRKYTGRTRWLTIVGLGGPWRRNSIPGSALLLMLCEVEG